MEDKLRERVEEQISYHEEKRTYRRYMRLMAGGMCSLIGTMLALYVGGWMMVFEPVKGTLAAYFAGTLTYKGIGITVLKCLLSTTAGGAIWCGGYILHRKIVGHPDY